MSRSLYKSTLDFLIGQSSCQPKGNHLRRLQVLAGMVSSCIRTKSSSLEGLSTPQEESTKQSESMIKQAKRWLTSKWTDWESFFAPYVTPLLHKVGAKGELILIMDGSETAGDCTTLMLSFVWGNYAIPLVWFTREGNKGHFSQEAHLALVDQVYELIPPHCRVVLLGDGEFDGSKLRQSCRQRGWEFVLRTSLDCKIECGGEMACIRQLCPASGHGMVFVQDALQGDNAILWRGKGHKDPIPLLTNMELGAMACRYYRKRFKIESMFKSMKSAGFNLHKSKVCGVCRVANLILVVALAFVLTICVGFIIKKQPRRILNSFTRADRVPKMAPILLVQKCLDKASTLALTFFSELSKNWTDFILNFSLQKVYG